MTLGERDSTALNTSIIFDSYWLKKKKTEKSQLQKTMKPLKNPWINNLVSSYSWLGARYYLGVSGVLVEKDDEKIYSPRSSQQTSMESEEQSLRSSREASVSS